MANKDWGKFRKLYGTQRWRRIAKAQLASHPLCGMCEKVGKAVAGNVCDHVNGHPADETEDQFWGGPFMTLCARCHNGAKRQLERSGYERGCDPSGAPFGRPDW